jgi:predicted nucleic acid-binding protein
MILIADTSPLNYLVQIDHFDIVERLYGHVIIPEAVYRELTALQSPHKVRTLELGGVVAPFEASPAQTDAAQLAHHKGCDTNLMKTPS